MKEDCERPTYTTFYRMSVLERSSGSDCVQPRARKRVVFDIHYTKRYPTETIFSPRFARTELTNLDYAVLS